MCCASLCVLVSKFVYVCACVFYVFMCVCASFCVFVYSVFVWWCYVGLQVCLCGGVM